MQSVIRTAHPAVLVMVAKNVTQLAWSDICSTRPPIHASVCRSVLFSLLTIGDFYFDLGWAQGASWQGVGGWTPC